MSYDVCKLQNLISTPKIDRFHGWKSPFIPSEENSQHDRRCSCVARDREHFHHLKKKNGNIPMPQYGIQRETIGIQRISIEATIWIHMNPYDMMVLKSTGSSKKNSQGPVTCQGTGDGRWPPPIHTSSSPLPQLLTPSPRVSSLASDGLW